MVSSLAIAATDVQHVLDASIAPCNHALPRQPSNRGLWTIELPGSSRTAEMLLAQRLHQPRLFADRLTFSIVLTQ